MVCLTTHFIHGYMASDHSNSEKKPVAVYWLFFPISSKGSFTCTVSHTTVFVTPAVKHWLEREIAQWVLHEGSIQRPIAP